MRKFKTMAGTVVCITKVTKKSLVEMTRNFHQNPFEFKNVKVTIVYKNGRFESYSFYNIDKEKISYSTINLSPILMEHSIYIMVDFIFLLRGK